MKSASASGARIGGRRRNSSKNRMSGHIVGLRSAPRHGSNFKGKGPQVIRKSYKGDARPMIPFRLIGTRPQDRARVGVATSADQRGPSSSSRRPLLSGFGP